MKDAPYLAKPNYLYIVVPGNKENQQMKRAEMKDEKKFTSEEMRDLAGALAAAKSPPDYNLTVTQMLERDLGQAARCKNEEGWSWEDISQWLADRGVSISPQKLGVMMSYDPDCPEII